MKRFSGNVGRIDTPNLNLVNPSYEYTVFRVQSGEGAKGVKFFQADLNANAAQGWELVSFSYVQTPSPTFHIYVGVMKRPK